VAETSSNIEFAHRIHEQGHSGTGPHSPRTERLEILEAIALSAVAILTAWSGYQAALWDGKSAESYIQLASTNVQAQEQQTLAGQERLYDVTTFNAWLQAKVGGSERLAAEFERRFRPEYLVAFTAWMKTDPLKNAQAPAGPIFMDEYRSARLAEAKRLSDEAKHLFERGLATREIGDGYVRITVLLATVLLLTALSQRLKFLGPRRWLLGVAFLMLVSAIYRIATLPRA
jgi:hypothetical protein